MDAECPLQRDVSPAPNVPGLTWPQLKSKSQADRVFVTVSAIVTRRNKEGNEIYDIMHQSFATCALYFDRQFQLEMYYG